MGASLARLAGSVATEVAEPGRALGGRESGAGDRRRALALREPAERAPTTGFARAQRAAAFHALVRLFYAEARGFAGPLALPEHVRVDRPAASQRLTATTRLLAGSGARVSEAGAAVDGAARRVHAATGNLGASRGVEGTTGGDPGRSLTFRALRNVGE